MFSHYFEKQTMQCYVEINTLLIEGGEIILLLEKLLSVPHVANRMVTEGTGVAEAKPVT